MTGRPVSIGLRRMMQYNYGSYIDVVGLAPSLAFLQSISYLSVRHRKLILSLMGRNCVYSEKSSDAYSIAGMISTESTSLKIL